ncbi:hypothetical protein CPB83DRAFT_862904 [Crepidotus variabilis]|uniref:Uncharacterized protein n=1 Tax=Crepidotus variabilis TaxID=179855 RepID=A0A9P6E6I7_9AGAR|nr:hypothetical protein CPB83DRAFT_862904 [Crepidotus variabilis]
MTSRKLMPICIHDLLVMNAICHLYAFHPENLPVSVLLLPLTMFVRLVPLYVLAVLFCMTSFFQGVQPVSEHQFFCVQNSSYVKRVYCMAWIYRLPQRYVKSNYDYCIIF